MRSIRLITVESLEQIYARLCSRWVVQGAPEYEELVVLESEPDLNYFRICKPLSVEDEVGAEEIEWYTRLLGEPHWYDIVFTMAKRDFLARALAVIANHDKCFIGNESDVHFAGPEFIRLMAKYPEWDALLSEEPYGPSV